MKKTAKRLLALGMTLSIAVGMFPVTAMAANGMPDSYDFRGKTAEAVKASWSIAGDPVREDTTLWSVGDSGLTLKTHNGDIYAGQESAKNIFVQSSVANSDYWVAETKITLGEGFNGGYQQGAILAYQNDGYYVKLSYEYNPGTSHDNANPMILQLVSEENNGTPTGPNIKVTGGAAEGTVVYLQLEKDGNKYSAAYSIDGVNFMELDGYVTNEMTAPMLAITANNGGVTATEENPEVNMPVTFAYVAAMTKAQAGLEATIAGLPAVGELDAEDDFTDIKSAYAAYSAMDAGLRDTVVSNADELTALVARVAEIEADIEAAKDVDDLIAAIVTPITLESKDAIAAARAAYDALTDAQKALVKELAKLEAAEVSYVDVLIDDIGTVKLTDACKAKIDAAKAAFGKLTPDQQNQVSKKDDLTAAEAAYTALANKYDFVTKVADIGTTITKDSKAKIDAAEAAYALLTEAQKTEVSTDYATLTTAETVLGVVEKIEAIGTVAATSDCKAKIDAAYISYRGLTSDQKTMVGNYSTLQDAEKVYSAMSLINAIGTVSLDSKDKIAEARTAYDALTSAQKLKVGNSDTLLAAEVSYVKALINDIGTVTLDSKTKVEAARAAYDKLVNSAEKGKVTNYSKLTDAEKALADLTAADAVDAKIDAIGTVEATSACKAKIDAARTAYNALTTEQKALVKKYDDLLNAEELYALLTALGNVCDGGTGCPAFLLTDVDPDQWYHKAVDYVLTEGLFKGVSTTQFAPNNTMTRAMIWTVLARMDDANLAVTTPWYKSAQNWAVNNQVSDGTTPDGSVTREQLVTMLWRFMDEPQANGSLAGYPDAGKVSSWAKEAMTWAVANGVVQGVGNANGTVTLNPGATATRAQVAQMFMNFLTK